jgi:hypothetical protein
MDSNSRSVFRRTRYQTPSQTPSITKNDEFQSSVRKQWYTLLLASFTAFSMAFTVFFAYNSSMESPLSSKLIFSKPERSILVLNIASQLTIFCLAELTLCVLETVRWAFACSVVGTSAHTFLALSRATNAVGVLSLLFDGNPSEKRRRDGVRIWGGQRHHSKPHS